MILAGYPIEIEDIEIRRVEKEGFAAETISIGEGEASVDVSLVLDMSLNDELISNFKTYHKSFFKSN